MPLLRISLVLAVGAVALLGGDAALAQSLEERKQEIDARISGLQHQIASAKNKEGVLAAEIDTASSTIEDLEGRVAEASEKLARLESELDRHRARLAELTARYREQTRRLAILRREHGRAERRLEERLVELYETGQVDQVAVLLQAESLGELIERLDYFTAIGRQDKEIVFRLHRLKGEMHRAREETARTKEEVAEATALLAEKTAEQRAVRADLVAQRDALAAARQSKQRLLADVRDERHHDEEDVDELNAASAQLAATIQAAQAAAAAEAAAREAAAQEAARQAAAEQAAAQQAAPSTGGGGSSGGGGGSSSGGSSSGSSAGGAAPSSSGLVWPVSGVVTSGFGYRSGRLHAGIDISAPTGTPVRAAASGRVIHAGWMGGYGNLIVIDHGGGLATAYAHLSAIWVGSGSVSQGRAIGAVGCTGSCTGSHLHFEVRVNGQPVDPLGYL